MKKIIISISFILSFIIAFGQPNEVQRSTGANTVIDPNLAASRSFRQPVFNDTTSANNSFLTLDSVGKIIFTRDVMGMWVRIGYPKRWVSVGAGGSSIPTLDQVIVAGPSTDEFINFFDNAGIVFESTGTPAYLGGGGASNGIAISDNLTDYGYLNMSAITATRDYRFPDSSGTIALLSNITGGTVTNIATGNGLTGGPITTTGTISISPTWRDSIIGLITIQRSFDNQVGGAVLTKKDTILNSGYKLFFVGTNSWLGNESEYAHDFFDLQAPVTIGLLDTAKLRTGSTSAFGGNPAAALYVDRILRFPNETGEPKSISTRWGLATDFTIQVADSALANTVAGDLFAAGLFRNEWEQLSGYTGRSVVTLPTTNTPLWATASVVGINYIHGGGTATDNMYLKGWYAAFNAHIIMQTAFDSVENYVYFNAIGGNAAATNFRIDKSYMFMGDVEEVGVTGGLYGVYIRKSTAKNYFGGSVQIGTNGSGTYTETPNTSALLELNSTAQGVLFPRMTAAQRLAISSPANGLFVEDTDSSRYFGYTTALGWKGIAWTGEYNNGYGLNLSSNVFSLDSATVYTYVRSVAGGGGSSYTFTSPLVNTAGTVDIGGLSGMGTANFMVGVNSGATGWEYKNFVVGTAGTNFTIDHTANTVTFNIPAASTTATGFVNITTQSFIGTKTFASIINASGGLFTSGTGTSSNLGAYGGSTPGNLSTTAAFIVESATGTIARITSLGTTTTTLTANYNYAGIAVGQMPVTEATSGTTPLITMLMLRSTTVTNGAGATANVSGLYIEGPPTGITPTTSTSALWAKLGDIKVTNGSLLLETAGNKINIATGSNASVGISGAMTSGSITISTTAVTANSIIQLTPVGAGSGQISIGTITAGTSFVINSSDGADTRIVHWTIIN